MTEQKIIVTLYYKPIKRRIKKKKEGWLIGVIKEYPFVIGNGKDLDSLRAECMYLLNHYLKLVKQGDLPRTDHIESTKRFMQGFIDNPNDDEEEWKTQEITIVSNT